jgi:hypothetical protein
MKCSGKGYYQGVLRISYREVSISTVSLPVIV